MGDRFDLFFFHPMRGRPGGREGLAEGPGQAVLMCWVDLSNAELL